MLFFLKKYDLRMILDDFKNSNNTNKSENKKKTP